LADAIAQEDTLLQTLQTARALGQLLGGITTYSVPDYTTTTMTGKMLKHGWISAPFDFSKILAGANDTFSLRDQIMDPSDFALPQVDIWLATHPIDGCNSLADARHMRDDIDNTDNYVLRDIAVAYLITNPDSPFNSEVVAGGDDILIGQYPIVEGDESDLLGHTLYSYWSNLGSLAVSVSDVGTLALADGDQYIWILDKTLVKLIEIKVKPGTFYVIPSGTFDIIVSNGAFYCPSEWTNYYIPPSSPVSLSYTPQSVLTGVYGSKINRSDGAAMVWVPGGSFTMGSIVGVGYHDEQPAHQVSLSGFWMFENEVTVAQYRTFCTATGHSLPPWPGSDYSWTNYTNWTAPPLQQMPIVNVSWDDSKLYADWAGVQLPTEAQYEYAARGPYENNYPWGGVSTAADPYNGWDQTKCANNYNSCAVGKSTWPVGSFPAGASWCGAQDLTGNVYGWCADWYGNYSITSVSDPAGPATGDYRVLRGGSWDFDYYNRGSSRSTGSSTDFWNNVGFRCVAISPGP